MSCLAFYGYFQKARLEFSIILETQQNLVDEPRSYYIQPNSQSNEMEIEVVIEQPKSNSIGFMNNQSTLNNVDLLNNLNFNKIQNDVVSNNNNNDDDDEYEDIMVHNDSKPHDLFSTLMENDSLSTQGNSEFVSPNENQLQQLFNTGNGNFPQSSSQSNPLVNTKKSENKTIGMDWIIGTSDSNNNKTKHSPKPYKPPVKISYKRRATVLKQLKIISNLMKNYEQFLNEFHKEKVSLISTPFHFDHKFNFHGVYNKNLKFKTMKSIIDKMKQQQAKKWLEGENQLHLVDDCIENLETHEMVLKKTTQYFISNVLYQQIYERDTQSFICVL